MRDDLPFQIGDSATLSRSITDKDIRGYADLLGDHNPIHLDDEFARSTRFQGRIAHGLIAAGLMANLLGTELPGHGTVYLRQTLQFLAPVRPGDRVTATVEVVSMHATKPVLTLRTTCRNQEDELVLDGEAVVLYDPAPARNA